MQNKHTQFRLERNGLVQNGNTAVVFDLKTKYL